MSKRKKNKLSKTLKRSRVILHDFGFDFTHTTSQTSILIKEFTKPYFDTRHFEIKFEPPISKKDALDANIRMIYMPTKTCDIKFYVATSETGRITVLDKKHKYISYYTHTVQIDSKKGIIPLLYVSIQDTQMNGDSSAKPEYKLMYTTIQHDRYEPLPFFPPDPNITNELNIPGGIDSRLVSQSIRMTFKSVSKATITSSTVLELLGFDFGNKQKKNDGWHAVNMRFGSIKEREVTVHLLEDNPLLQVKECGFYPHPVEDDWGAKPDLLLIDQSITEENIPKSLLKGTVKKEIQFGTAEIKSSRFNSDFRDYHIPQCLWHMICVDTLWNLLIVYCEKKALNPETRNWVKTKFCKTIRLFRNAELEEEMISLMMQSVALKQQNKPQEFVELVHSQPYKDIREKFASIAKDCNKQAQPVHVKEDTVEQYLKNNSSNDDDFDYVPSLHPAIDRIEQRQVDIFRLYQEPKQTHYEQLVLEISKQIQDYTLLLRE